ncbi:SHD1 domain-containing protein [Stieleria sp. TO1_6]|nr:SHD1 domain-containing protein [Stieleria tagensis]
MNCIFNVNVRVVVIAAALLSPSEAFSQESKTWSDKTGNFSVEAVLNSQDARSVRLTTTDGREITVLKSKLSQADLEFLDSKQPNMATPSAAEAEALLTETLAGPAIVSGADVALDKFASQINVNVFIDRRGFEEIGLAPSIPIDTSGAAASLADQLDAMLGQHKLTWYRMRTVLVITTADAAEDNAAVAIAYRIPIPKNDFASVASKIQSVEPKSWDVMGGIGSVKLLPTAVVIRQTPQIHRQLARQLSLRPNPHRYAHPLDNEIVSLEISDGTLDIFAQALTTELNRKVDVSSSVADQRASSIKLDHVSAKDALDLMVGQVDCQWLEHGMEIEIVSAGEAKGNLEQRRVAMAFASAPVSSLVLNTMMTMIEPRSWSPLGGPGTIQFAGGKNFIISQTQPTFRNLDQLLADLGS